MVNLIRTALFMTQMKRNQWKTESELELLQEERLCALVKYASKYVPHYKNVRIKNADDLISLPIIKKKDIRDNANAFISKRYNRYDLTRLQTSGSTGIPLSIYEDGHGNDYRLALEYQQLSECGIGPLDIQAQIAHYSINPCLLQKLNLFRRSYLSVQNDEKSNLLALQQMKPDALHTYPSILASLVNIKAKENIEFRVKKIFSRGELLSEKTRNLVTKSFGCNLHDFYGNVETHWVAWECPEGSMHIHSDSVIVEITDDEGNRLKEGKEGNMVITPLWKTAMPLIRYHIGDRAIIGSKCSCGRGLKVLKSLHGRNDDFIVLPSGKIRSARCINLMDEMEELMVYQIIQEKEDLFVFRFVPSKNGLSKKCREKIRKIIKNGCLGEEIKIEFEMVNKIERSNSHKIKTFISKIS